ncbi:MAG TPA: extracellular solute-binding protein [Symbiobacteriaceae bacterium]|jgi:multiple sugar transport system substrate-binding protein
MRRSIAALVVTALVMAGCSMAPKVSTPAAVPASKGTVRLLILGGPGYDQQLITGFKNNQPGITVEPVELPEGDYQAIMDKLKSGEVKVDAIVAPANPFLFAQGIAAPLDDFINSNKLDLAPYDTAIEFGKYQGKTYGLPVSTSPMAVVYNKDVFEKLSIPAPKAGWTWDDFASAAKKLQPEFVGKDMAGTAIAPWGLMDILLTAGKGPTDPDLSAFEATLTRFQKYYVTDKLLSLNAIAENDGGYFQKLAQGKVGMLLGYWSYSFAHDKPAVNWGVAPLPGSGKTPAIATLAMIAAKAEHPDTAAAFVKFATGADGAQTVARMPGAPVPGFIDKNAEHVWLANAGLPQDTDFLSKLQYIAPTEYPEALATSVIKQLDAVLSKGKAPADAVRDFKQEREKIMAQK